MKISFLSASLIFCSVAASPAPPCSYSLSPTAASYSADGGAGLFTVTVGSGCSWTASTTNGWIHTSSSGVGSGNADYTVDANAATSSRQGSINVANQTFTISQ